MLLRFNVRSAVRRVRCSLLPPRSIRASRYTGYAANHTIPAPDHVLFGAPDLPLPWHTPKGAPKDKGVPIMRAKSELPFVRPSTWEHLVAQHSKKMAEVEMVGRASERRKLKANLLKSEKQLEMEAAAKSRGKEERNTRCLWGLPTDKDGTYIKLVRRFNTQIWNAKRHPYGDGRAAYLFKQYELVRTHIPGALEDLPEEAWRVLWKTQSAFRPMDLARLENMRTLVEDMEVFGQDSSRERPMLYLEEMAAMGEASKAVKEWKTAFAQHGTQISNRKEWLELGARLHVLAGNFDEACTLIVWAIKHHKSFDPRCMLLLIWKHAETGDPDSMRKAWAIYEKLKVHETFAFNTSDYRSLVTTFLHGGHRNATLQIIKDLATDTKLTDGFKRRSNIMSAMDEVQSNCQTQQTLTHACLTALSFLSQSTDWHLFFHQWLKYASQFRGPPIDSCAQIVELMFERGHRPQARHLEEMIRAWLRADNPRNDKALMIAWDMINKRLDEMGSKDVDVAAKATEENSKSPYHGVPILRILSRTPLTFERHMLPTARARTFTLIALYYSKKNEPERALQLLNFLSEADLPLDKRSVRDIILVQFYLGRPLMAWTVFNDIRNADPNCVNLHTYSVLWRTLSRHASTVNANFKRTQFSHEDYMLRWRLRDEEGHQLPYPRELFSDTLHFIRTQHVPATGDSQAAAIPGFVLDHVLLTFFKTKDTLGAYVAMKALKNHLDVTPNLRGIDTVVLWTALRAATIESRETIEEGKHLDLDSFKDLAYGVLEHFIANCTTKEGPTVKPCASDLYDSIFIKENGSLIYDVLSTYLYKLMENHWGSTDIVEQQIRRCEEEMGVYGLPEEHQVNEEVENLEEFFGTLTQDGSITFEESHALSDLPFKEEHAENHPTADMRLAYEALQAHLDVEESHDLSDFETELEGLNGTFSSGEHAPTESTPDEEGGSWSERIATRLAAEEAKERETHPRRMETARDREDFLIMRDQEPAEFHRSILRPSSEINPPDSPLTGGDDTAAAPPLSTISDSNKPRTQEQEDVTQSPWRLAAAARPGSATAGEGTSSTPTHGSNTGKG